MTNWFPLHTHSHYSLLDGLSKPEQIADRCKQLGYSGCAITDHGSISGAVQFAKHLKKASLKPILGNEFYICPLDATNKEKENDRRSHLCTLAKNLNGWKSLIQATSESNNPNLFYRKPRLNLERLAGFSKGNFIVFSGHIGSDLADILFDNPKAAYSTRTTEQAQMMLRSDWKEKAASLAGKYQELFGKENFWLEIQLIDAKNSPVANVIANSLRIVGKQNGIPCVATADSHYPSKEDAEDQRILLCSAFETTLNEVRKKLENEEDVTLAGFFRSNRYHIPSVDELISLHEPDEIQNSLLISEMCEKYDILGQPLLPVFNCPDNLTPDEYLHKLAIQGWRNLIEPRTRNGIVKGFIGTGWSCKDVPIDVYKQRIINEMKVVKGAGLSSYFLIVQDYCQFTRNQGWLVGPGRGSGAGCLLSYLIGITGIDPIPFDLMFERFYNAGRNQPGRVSLPDIDCDFPIRKREFVKDYIRNKYGYVSEIATFSRIMGRGALKDVLRAHEYGTFEEWNKITEHIPDESAIAEELQAMREDGEEPSIIQWALENNSEQLKEWCRIGKDGKYEGPIARYFAQARRLEGTKRSQSKHAAGIVISANPLTELCPMVPDKGTGQLYAGLEMGDLEAMGLPKFDILGVAALDKIQGVQELLASGRIA